VIVLGRAAGCDQGTTKPCSPAPRTKWAGSGNSKAAGALALHPSARPIVSEAGAARTAAPSTLESPLLASIGHSGAPSRAGAGDQSWRNSTGSCRRSSIGSRPSAAMASSARKPTALIRSARLRWLLAGFV